MIVPQTRTPGSNTSPTPGSRPATAAPTPPSRQDGLAIIAKLPPLPTVITKLMQLMQRKDVGLKEISNTVGSDPAFSAEELRLANSAMIGAKAEVRSISQALALIGTDRVKGLALTVGMRGTMGKNANLPALRRCWRHTLATAILAEEIADKVYIDPSEAYAVGLLHDIGCIALIATFPEKYTAIFDSGPKTPAQLLTQEREAFGLDHREAGVELVRKWKLPPLFERVITYGQEESDAELRIFDCPALIDLASGLAHAIGLGFLPVAEGTDWQAECQLLLEKVPEADRKRLNYCWEDLQLLIASKVNLLDSEAFK